MLYNSDNNYDDKKNNLSSIVEYPKYKSVNIEHSAIEHSHTASRLEYAWTILTCYIVLKSLKDVKNFNSK